MAKKDLKYFMRSTEAEIVTAPGPESFKDEDGNVIPFEIKVLTQAEINQIIKRAIRLLLWARLFGKPRKTAQRPPVT